MKERKKSGGRMSDKSFNVEPGSVAAELQFKDKETRDRYYANRAKHDADARAMESWASQGCTSMPVGEYE